MTMITPSYLGETIEYSSLHACRSTLEDPTWSRRFLRGVSGFGLFAGMLLMTSSLIPLLGYSATEHLGFGWLTIGGCATATLLLCHGGRSYDRNPICHR